jgi:hypothetical protein
MAKGPGPAVALLGLGALFMIAKGKKGGKTATKPWEQAEAEGEAADTGTSGNGGGGGGGTGSGQPPGPPNVSGHPDGYNANFFSNWTDVNAVFKAMGYAAPAGEVATPPAVVRKFQEQYNEASGAGKFGAVATLKVDGVPGKNSLNAIEAVLGRGQPLKKGDFAQGAAAMARATQWDLYFP